MPTRQFKSLLRSLRLTVSRISGKVVALARGFTVPTIVTAGALAAIFSVPPEAMEGIISWTRVNLGIYHDIKNPAREGKGFDRCVYSEHVHHCGGRYTKVAATLACKRLGYDRALEAPSWKRVFDGSVWIFDGFIDETNRPGEWKEIKVGDKIVMGPEERVPGAEVLVKELGILDRLQCI